MVPIRWPGDCKCQDVDKCTGRRINGVFHDGNAEEEGTEGSKVADGLFGKLLLFLVPAERAQHALIISPLREAKFSKSQRKIHSFRRLNDDLVNPEVSPPFASNQAHGSINNNILDAELTSIYCDYRQFQHGTWEASSFGADSIQRPLFLSPLESG